MPFVFEKLCLTGDPTASTAGGEAPAASEPPLGVGKRFGSSSLMLDIVVWTKSERETLCMGKVGTMEKFCVDPICLSQIGGPKTHLTEKSKITPTHLSPSETHVFVRIKPTVTSANLCLPVEAFGGDVETYKQEKRTFAQWESFFFQPAAIFATGTSPDVATVTALGKTSKRLGTPISLHTVSAKK